MLKRLSIGFATLALAAASAATTYRVTLFQPSVINGTELKPGEYKVEVNNDKAVIRSGKSSTEAPVKVESNDQKFRTNVVRYGPESRVQEIRLGGTKTRLIFESAAPSSTPAGQ